MLPVVFSEHIDIENVIRDSKFIVVEEYINDVSDSFIFSNSFLGRTYQLSPT